MILLPAIDLYGGKVVRLTKGDYAQMTVYHDDPAAQAAQFQAAGARWLHTVDLEGAKDGFGDHVAVGVDIKEGAIAIRGWLETARESVEDCFQRLCGEGVKTVICTDVSKDGMLSGTNVDLYRRLSQAFPLDLIASGGVSSLEDVKKLRELGLYGAILGKALYTGALDLKEALKETEG